MTPYACVLALVALATGATWTLTVAGADTPWAPFYVAIATTTWLESDGPAWLAVILSSVMVQGLLRGQIGGSFAEELPSLIYFFIVVSLIVILIRKRIVQLNLSSTSQPIGEAAPGDHLDVVIPRIGAQNHTESMLYPRRLLTDVLDGRPQDFFSLEIEGNVASLGLRSGDSVVIDRRRRAPVEPGMFAVDEGLGPVLKWIEVVPHSMPLRYRVRRQTSGADFILSEVDAQDVEIIGRAVWAGTRL